MANTTVEVVPSDVTDSTQLRRFLNRLVENIDVAFGNRDESPFASEDEDSDTTVSSRLTTLENNLDQNTVDDPSLITVSPSASYTQSEIVSIVENIETLSSKIEELIDALQDANILY